MKYNIQYIGLLLLLLIWSCGEKPMATTSEDNSTTVAAATPTEENKVTPTVSTTVEEEILEKTPTTIVAPYQLAFTIYEGQWFELDYPKDFSIKKQKNEMEKEDPYRGDISLFLTAPDQHITFFAFPLYGQSKPKGIAINTATEEYINNSQHQQGSKVMIRAKDGSYIREYQYDEFHFWGQQYDTPTTKALYTDAFERFYQSITATEG